MAVPTGTRISLEPPWALVPILENLNMIRPSLRGSFALLALAAGSTLSAGQALIKNANAQYPWTLCFLDDQGRVDLTRTPIKLAPGHQMAVTVTAAAPARFILKDWMGWSDILFRIDAQTSANGSETLNCSLLGRADLQHLDPEVQWDGAILTVLGDESVSHGHQKAKKAGIKNDRKAALQAESAVDQKRSYGANRHLFSKEAEGAAAGKTTPPAAGPGGLD